MLATLALLLLVVAVTTAREGAFESTEPDEDVAETSIPENTAPEPASPDRTIPEATAPEETMPTDQETGAGRQRTGKVRAGYRIGAPIAW